MTHGYERWVNFRRARPPISLPRTSQCWLSHYAYSIIVCRTHVLLWKCHHHDHLISSVLCSNELCVHDKSFSPQPVLPQTLYFDSSLNWAGFITKGFLQRRPMGAYSRSLFMCQCICLWPSCWDLSQMDEIVLSHTFPWKFQMAPHYDLALKIDYQRQGPI